MFNQSVFAELKDLWDVLYPVSNLWIKYLIQRVSYLMCSLMVYFQFISTEDTDTRERQESSSSEEEENDPMPTVTEIRFVPSDKTSCKNISTEPSN